MGKSLTDARPMLRETALVLTGVCLGDYVVLPRERVMRLDGWDCFTKCFVGRVMMQPVETTSAVHVTKLIPKGGERELEVRCRELPMKERGVG